MATMKAVTVWSRPQQLEEAEAILTRALDALLATGRSPDQAGWELRYAVGKLRATALESIVDGTLGEKAVAIWQQARTAGTSYLSFDALRKQIVAEVVTAVPGAAVAHLLVRLTLVQMSILSAAREFASRDDALAALNEISAAFATAEEDATDERDPMTYQTVVALRGAVVRDLADRARRLPRVVPYSFGAVMPSLWIANRLYADASRSDEIRAENKIIHPAFCRPDGICLSS